MNYPELKGRVALVTGAARGIGHNIARRLAQCGCNVWIGDVDPISGRAAIDTLRQAGLAAKFVEVDLARAGNPQSIVRQVVDQAGGIDILVNNARAGKRVTLEDESEDNWETVFGVIVKAAFFASQEALHHMTRRGHGSIVNIGSVAASLTTHESPSYHAAKAALTHLTRYLAASVGAPGIRVNCVTPGLIVKDEDRSRFDSEDNSEDRLLAERVHPLRRAGRADDVADAVLYLASDSASFVNGQSIVVDGGLTVQEPFDLVTYLRPSDPR